MNNGEKVSLEIDSTLRQKCHVFVTITFEVGHGIVEYVGRTDLECMENHMAEVDD